jgi:hypothetical protein
MSRVFIASWAGVQATGSPIELANVLLHFVVCRAEPRSWTDMGGAGMDRGTEPNGQIKIRAEVQELSTARQNR